MKKKALLFFVLLVAGCNECQPHVNMTLCEQSLSESAKERCYEIGIKNVACIETCNKTPEGLFRDRCYYTIADKWNNTKVCQNIVNSSLRQTCEEKA